MRRERRRLAHRPPQRHHAIDIVVLLVAVERAAIRRRRAVQHRGDRRQAIDILRDVAADLQLEPCVAVDRHHLFQRLRQAVIDALAGLDVGRGDRVDQADRVARGDLRARRAGGQEAVDVEARQLGQELVRGDAGEVGLDRVVERDAEPAAQPHRARRGRSAPARSRRPADSDRASPRRRPGRHSAPQNARKPCGWRRRDRARARSTARRAAGRNSARWSAPGSCRTISAPAFQPRRPARSCRRQRRPARRQRPAAHASRSPHRSGTAGAGAPGARGTRCR